MDSNPNFKYTIYKTINKINGKMYIGCHKTTTPNDDYLGSGTILKRALKKYGEYNFKKSVLFIFDTPEEMFAKEAEIVDRLFLESEQTYNIAYGGHGNWKYANESGKNLYGKNGENGKRNLLNGKNVEKFLREHGMWEAWKQKLSASAKKYHRLYGTHWTGRKHNEETKRKISEKMKVAQQGNRNSNYGNVWIYSTLLKQSKRIPKKECETYLQQGWSKGRRMKF